MERLRLRLRHRPLRHGRLGDETVRPLQETEHTLHALRGPRLHRLQRTHEHLVEPQRIRAVIPHHIIRIDDILERLRHLRRELREQLRFILGAAGFSRLRAVRLAVLPRHLIGGDQHAARRLEGRPEDHALIHEPLERLLRGHQSEIKQNLVPETRVQKM